VLALATLSSQEKLRNIVSLLVDGQVKKIIVICLLNRMGPFTTNFIRAIERFTKRVTVDGPVPGDASITLAAAAGEGAPVMVAGSAQRPAAFTDFCFSMVYSLLDLRDVDLISIGSELEWLFSDFRTKTKVPSFVRLCDRMEGYFHSKPFIERAYSKTPYAPLSQPYRLMIEGENGAQPVEVKTQEAKVALMTYNLALNRDFKPVLEELVATLDRRTFIHLYGLLLSDVHHLRFAGTLRTLKESVLARLAALRRERFSVDVGSGGEPSEALLEKLRELINAEVYLLFGLGIIAHYDSRENLKGLAESAVELLFCEKTPEEWLNLHPLSLQEYFSEERVFFVIAFLLRGLFPQFNRGEVAADIKRRLNDAAESFKKTFKQKFGALAKSEKALKARASLIMNNLDLILTETGSHDNLEKHQIVRYLHREVLRPKEGHNPIFTTLSSLIAMMNERAEAGDPSQEHDFEVEESQFLMRVDEALSGTSSLHMIALEVRQLFFFTPTVQDQQERYTSPVGQPGFANDIDELVRRLGEIRQRNKRIPIVFITSDGGVFAQERPTPGPVLYRSKDNMPGDLVNDIMDFARANVFDGRKVFLIYGHDRKSGNIRADIMRRLKDLGLDVKSITPEESMLSLSNQLIEKMSRCSGFIALCTPDDKVDEEWYQPRQNVLLEIGIVMGMGNGFERLILLQRWGSNPSERAQLPSDLAGALAIRFYDGNNYDDTLDALVRGLKERGLQIQEGAA
jgi:predicted nucleotide-binding protein